MVLAAMPGITPLLSQDTCIGVDTAKQMNDKVTSLQVSKEMIRCTALTAVVCKQSQQCWRALLYRQQAQDSSS